MFWFDNKSNFVQISCYTDISGITIEFFLEVFHTYLSEVFLFQSNFLSQIYNSLNFLGPLF